MEMHWDQMFSNWASLKYLSLICHLSKSFRWDNQCRVMGTGNWMVNVALSQRISLSGSPGLCRRLRYWWTCSWGWRRKEGLLKSLNHPSIHFMFVYVNRHPLDEWFLFSVTHKWRPPTVLLPQLNCIRCGALLYTISVVTHVHGSVL